MKGQIWIRFLVLNNLLCASLNSETAYWIRDRTDSFPLEQTKEGIGNFLWLRSDASHFTGWPGNTLSGDADHLPEAALARFALQKVTWAPALGCFQSPLFQHKGQPPYHPLPVMRPFCTAHISICSVHSRVHKLGENSMARVVGFAPMLLKRSWSLLTPWIYLYCEQDYTALHVFSIHCLPVLWQVASDISNLYNIGPYTAHWPQQRPDCMRNFLVTYSS